MIFALLLFGAETGVNEWIDKFGPSGIAAVVMVWLTHRHEKVIKEIMTSHENSIGKINISLEKLNTDAERRTSENRTITEKQIETIGGMAKNVMSLENKIQILIDENRDLQRRVEVLEKQKPG